MVIDILVHYSYMTQSVSKTTSQSNTKAVKIRLNKYLADLGVTSRRKADELIVEGRILVNEKVAVVGQLVAFEDEIQFDGKKLNHQTDVPLEYWIVNKPRGYVSTVTDPERRPTAVSLIKSKQRLYPVGRLDIESEGMLLLTNDGELTNLLTHPRYHVPKTYHVWVTGEVTPRKLNKLRNGVKLTDGLTAPTDIVSTMLRSRKAALTITLYEGRSRQIRRMMPQVDLEVAKLKRVAIGQIQLGGLRVGESRMLNSTEVKLLYKLKDEAKEA